MVWLACTASEPRLQAAQLRQHQFGGLGPRQRRPRLVEEDAAGLGELDAAADAVEEGGAVAVLEHADGRADRRRRQVERRGGLGEVLAFGDGDEDAKLVEGHGFRSI